MSDTCPKCGANTEYWQEEARRFSANADYWRARAEKAEAEVVRLREAIEARDWFVRDIGYPATCTYCGRRDSTHHTDCPTITHPVEALSPTGGKEGVNETD